MTHISFHGRQAGMVLLLCLIFLTALTMLGLAAAADTVLQNKLATNLKETERARQSAQAAMSEAERWLFGLEGISPEYCSDTCAGSVIHAPANVPSEAPFESLSWWLARGQQTGLDSTSTAITTREADDNTSKSVWIIEALHSAPVAGFDASYKQAWYRILARGSVNSDAIVSVIESTVVRVWPDNGSFERVDAAIPNACEEPESGIRCERLGWRELR